MDEAADEKVNKSVFYTSAALVSAFVLLGIFYTSSIGSVFGTIQNIIVTSFGWLYIVSVAFFLFFVIWLYFSSFGNIKLGKEDDLPEYRNRTWFAMLFSAGMGIGLLFYSVAEPILHIVEPRNPGMDSISIAKEAINLTFFHWGVHAWAIYIIVGLSLAYFSYRHDMPLTIRSTMYPIFGDRIYGFRGNLVEIIAIFGTLFGVATSLGLGVMQINAGMEYIGLMSVSIENQIILIAMITIFATTSVVSGLNKGIRILSQMNVGLGALLIIFVFITGPTVFLASSYVQSIGYYMQNLIALTFRTDAYRGVEWQSMWTMFYWGWWISWSPFVGMFIARISKGRTIREFIRGVLIAPALITFFWIIVFGNTAIHIELFGTGGISQVVQTSVPTALFVLLERLPLALLSSLLATVVITTFFVTSSDSGSLVISILSSNGNPQPAVSLRFFWAILQGAVAAVLLLTGGLLALQTAALTTALPFCMVMVLMCYSIVKGLRSEVKGTKLVEDTRINKKEPEETSISRTKILVDEIFRNGGTKK